MQWRPRPGIMEIRAALTRRLGVAPAFPGLSMAGGLLAGSPPGITAPVTEVGPGFHGKAAWTF